MARVRMDLLCPILLSGDEAVRAFRPELLAHANRRRPAGERSNPEAIPHTPGAQIRLVHVESIAGDDRVPRLESAPRFTRLGLRLVGTDLQQDSLQRSCWGRGWLR